MRALRDTSDASAVDEASGGEEGDGGNASGEDGSDSADNEDEPLRCGCCQEELTHVAPADEWLVCDGGCGRELPPAEERFVCTASAERCDWDVCRPCGGVARSRAPVAQLVTLPPVQHVAAAQAASSAAEAAVDPAIGAAIARAAAARAARCRAPSQRHSMQAWYSWQAARAAARQAARAATAPRRQSRCVPHTGTQDIRKFGDIENTLMHRNLFTTQHLNFISVSLSRAAEHSDLSHRPTPHPPMRPRSCRRHRLSPRPNSRCSSHPLPLLPPPLPRSDDA